MKTGHLTLYIEIIAVCSENHVTRNGLCGQIPNYSNFVHLRQDLPGGIRLNSRNTHAYVHACVSAYKHTFIVTYNRV